jgi:ketosteroid isomerase-like protein
MRIGPIAALALLAACSSAHIAPASAPSTSDAEAEVVAAEHAFAAAAARDGVRDAFLAFADDSALAFRPEPANAKELWRARPRTTGRLVWYPAIARAARSGDLGFTTGPYEAADSAGTVQGYGQYVTVWRKTPGGWRFVIDVGSPNPRPDVRPAEWRAIGRDPSSAEAGAAVDPDAERSLFAADSGFAARAAANGLAAALRMYGDAEMRLLRPRAFPHVGLGAALAAAAADGARRYTARPVRAFASAAGDLGWTWGEYQWVHPGAGRRESGHYVRTWARGPGGEWRVLLDVVAPRPPERDE